MCHQCESKCSSKQTKQCPKTKVICRLPYPITKSGHYCLGKDFTWSDASQSAITVLADNVVLDFNHRTITTDVASDVPLVSVQGKTDVVLKHVHLEGVGSGKYKRGGISVFGCKKIDVDSAVLLNLDGTRSLLTNCAMSLFSTDGVDVSNLYLKNDNDVSVGTGIAIDNVRNLSIHDSELYNAPIRGSNSQNVDLLRLDIDNTGYTNTDFPGLFLNGIVFYSDSDNPSFISTVENLRIADCNIRVKGFLTDCIFVPNFLPLELGSVMDSAMLYHHDPILVAGGGGDGVAGGAGEPVLKKSNEGVSDELPFAHMVTIENNNLTVIDGSRGIFSSGVSGGMIRGNTIYAECESLSTQSVGIQADDCSGVTITKNSIKIQALNPEVFVCLGITVNQGQTSQTTVLISGNNIHKSGFFKTSADIGIVFSTGLDDPSLEYNTIERNNVTGFQYGITDGFPSLPSQKRKAQCNIYSNNFSNGNGQNYFINEPVGTSIFLDNNVDGCVNPDLVPTA